MALMRLTQTLYNNNKNYEKLISNVISIQNSMQSEFKILHAHQIALNSRAFLIKKIFMIENPVAHSYQVEMKKQFPLHDADVNQLANGGMCSIFFRVIWNEKKKKHTHKIDFTFKFRLCCSLVGAIFTVLPIDCCR